MGPSSSGQRGCFTPSVWLLPLVTQVLLPKGSPLLSGPMGVLAVISRLHSPASNPHLQRGPRCGPWAGRRWASRLPSYKSSRCLLFFFVPTHLLSGQGLSFIWWFFQHTLIVLCPGPTLSVRGAIRLWGGAGEGCPASPHSGRRVWASASLSVRCRTPSPFLKGPGLAGSSWLLAPLRTYLAFPMSLSPTQTSLQDHLIQSPLLERLSKMPLTAGPVANQGDDGSTRRKWAQGGTWSSTGTGRVIIYPHFREKTEAQKGHTSRGRAGMKSSAL